MPIAGVVMKRIVSFLSKSACPEAADSRSGRTADVGWLLDTENAGFIWDSPRKLSRSDGKIHHAKGLTYCPAVVDFEARLFEIPCPIDIELRFKLEDVGDKPSLITIAGDQASIRPKYLKSMLSIIDRKEWRHPNRPIIQFVTPYIFLSDEAVYMNQIPAFCHYPSTPLPGVMIDGRMPIHIWPRPLMWAFEWYDTRKDLVIKRGEPWFYLQFETVDPARRIRLVEAAMTDTLQEYLTGLRGVTNYVNRTFSLFRTAQERRPKTLLTAKQR
jgi:hypothetical protein